jgi:hypothetical protein
MLDSPAPLSLDEAKKALIGRTITDVIETNYGDRMIVLDTGQVVSFEPQDFDGESIQPIIIEPSDTEGLERRSAQLRGQRLQSVKSMVW